MGTTYDARPVEDLREDYALVLEAKADAERLAAGGSLTATRELLMINRDLATLEAQIAAAVGGPHPVTRATEPPDTDALNAMHRAAVDLVEAADRPTRRAALGVLLPYIDRGEDLAFLLGYVPG